MTRAFPVSIRKAADKRAGGFCECGCGQPFTNNPKEGPEYDHILPVHLGGRNTLENCMVMRVCCHRTKTNRDDMPLIVKARRVIKERKNLKPAKRKIPGSRGSGFRIKLDGTVIKVTE